MYQEIVPARPVQSRPTYLPERRTANDSAHVLMEYNGIQYTKVGLRFPDQGVPFEVLEPYVQALRDMEEGIQWAIGDALNEAEDRFGELASQLTLTTGRTYQTLANYKWVARVIPFELRRQGVPWSHHEAVARLMNIDPEGACEILDMAAERDLILREVKVDVRTLLAELDADGIEGAGEHHASTYSQNGHQRQLEAQTSYYGLNDEGKAELPGPMSKDEALHQARVEWLDELMLLVLDVARSTNLTELENAQSRALMWARAHGFKA